MQILKFLFGIILAQIATYALVILSPDELTITELLRLVIPLLLIALIVAFWFTSMAGHYGKDAIGKAKDEFANEREKLRVNAQRAKERVQKAAQKDILNEATKIHAKANFKVGAAFAGLLGIGALFVFAQMITVGLLALSATGGAMGGYYWRGRRLENQRLKEIQSSSNFKVIESKPSRLKSSKH
ncbi:MAG: hypothetical protein OQK45_00365 [Sulfurovum sp.]|nr:hypothetical protein [Sulfurovum sp.]